MQIHNKKLLEDKRKLLRSNLTPAEALLWNALKKSQLEGRKFRRQHSIGNYIPDFYCPAERLAVELDGAMHFTVAGAANDDDRTAYLNSQRIKVLRFENKFVLEQLDLVLQEIKNHFKGSQLSS